MTRGDQCRENIQINEKSIQSRIPNGKSHEGILIKTQNNSNEKLSRAEKAECMRLMSRLPRHVLQTLLEELTSTDNTSADTENRANNLTQRESEVLVLVANSYTRAEIASTLGISPNTAARHIANIYRKLGISSVAEATNYAISAKLMVRGVKE